MSLHDRWTVFVSKMADRFGLAYWEAFFKLPDGPPYYRGVRFFFTESRARAWLEEEILPDEQPILLRLDAGHYSKEIVVAPPGWTGEAWDRDAVALDSDGTLS